jgi:Tol biopolymer transport system component
MATMMQFRCSPDGKWVVYNNGDSGKRTLWKISTDGGESVQLADKYARWPKSRRMESGLLASTGMNRVARPVTSRSFPSQVVQPIKLFDCPQTEETLAPIRWTPDGLAVTYVNTRSGVSNIMSQPIDGSPARQVTNFTSDEIFSYDWSSVNRQLVLSRGGWASNIVLISDSQSERSN